MSHTPAPAPMYSCTLCLHPGHPDTHISSCLILTPESVTVYPSPCFSLESVIFMRFTFIALAALLFYLFCLARITILFYVFSSDHTNVVINIA